jgi:DNA polymerase-1
MHDMKTLLLIDGNAIMHRAFFALPEMTAKDGTPTNAIHGFFGMLHKAVIDFAPDYVVVCFDTPTPTFRKKLFEEYQAHRPHIDDSLKTQFPLVMKLLDDAKITRMEKPGFEADDVIGTLATRFKSKSMRILILTGDKDIMQLVDDNVFVITPKIGLSSISIYDRQAVIDKLGITPAQIPDYKALAGDPSDNYKGVRGIGPKTASSLITRFGTVENMLKHIPDIEQEKTKNAIQQAHDEILLMKKLATIVTDVDIALDLPACAYHGFNAAMESSLHALDMHHMAIRLMNIKPVKVTVPEKADPEPSDNGQQGLF